MGWREEIATALGELVAIMGGTGRQPRWQRLGRAIRTKEAGWYAVDLRGSDIGPDQLDALRLAGPEPDGVEAKGFTVSKTVQNGSLLTLKVAEFADLTDAYLWLLKQPPTFLVEALRDGIAGLGETPLASALAAGSIGGTSSSHPDPPGFHPAQGDAYRACLGQGVHLVWGPPGTGKTTVLKRAIGDLIARGERVLLVSATNIAVDNALLGVVKENRHGPGDIVNSLSQSWTREVMVTMRGGHFARKLLEHEHAELFAHPPKCARCGGTSIELRRRTNGIWFWRCYDTVCKTGPKGRSNAWNQDIRPGGTRR